jgi:DNA-binding transcriptional MerR regulator
MSEASTVDIPDKTYFKIGEVAKLLDLEPYVLRYWESEFDVLEPGKTDSGQRIYQREDIELVCQIRGLLYDEMFTIAGARRQLELEREGKPNFATGEANSEAQSAGAPGDDQRDLWEERIASQTLQIQDLEEQLARARRTIEELEARPLPDAPGPIDPVILQGLRRQVEGLAHLARRPD